MATRVRKDFSKNLFGIVTMVISAAVLLGFLFSSEGLQSLNQISGNIRFLWLLGAFLAAVFAWVLEGLVLHLFCKKAYPEWKFHYSFLYGNGRCFIQRSDPLFHRRPAMQIYSMRRLGMDTGAAVHHRYENPGLSNRFGVLFFGYGCVEASLLSKPHQ